MITVVEFTNNKFKKKGFEEFSLNKLTWIDVLSPGTKELNIISEKTGIYLSDLQDSLDKFERPRITEEEGYIHIIFQTTHFNNTISTLPVGIFLLENTIITVHKSKVKSIERLMGNLEKTNTFFHKGKFFFMYRLLLGIISEFNNTLITLEEKLDKIEHRIYNPEKRINIENIYEIKKSLIYFRKALESDKEVIYKIERDFLSIIKQKNSKWFRDLYNEVLQVIDVEELLRTRISEAANLHLSMESYEMNQTMKRLAAYAAMIMVPTLISGIYGMNFNLMPELDWKYGYIFALSLMFTITVVLYIYFKKKDWI